MGPRRPAQPQVRPPRPPRSPRAACTSRSREQEKASSLASRWEDSRSAESDIAESDVILSGAVDGWEAKDLQVNQSGGRGAARIVLSDRVRPFLRTYFSRW